MNYLQRLPNRIQNKIRIDPDGCWRWTGAVNPNGYGVSTHTGSYTSTTAHRIVYEMIHGLLPKILHVDHLCRVRDCVNPDHLEAVTGRENYRRGNGFAGVNSRKTHCDHGHPLSGGNLYVCGDGWRHCRECRKLAVRRVRDRQRAKR